MKNRTPVSTPLTDRRHRQAHQQNRRAGWRRAALLALGALFSAATAADAILLAHEPFAYPEGSLTGGLNNPVLDSNGQPLNGGFGWAGPWVGQNTEANFGNIRGASLGYSAGEDVIAASGGSIQVASFRDMARPLEPLGNDTYYVSAILEHDTAEGTGRTRFRLTQAGQQAGILEVGFTEDGTNNLMYRLGSDTPVTGVASGVGGSNFVIIRFTMESGTMSDIHVWLNPEDLRDESANAAVAIPGSASGGIGSVRITRTSGVVTGGFDEIRVGTSWAAVTSLPVEREGLIAEESFDFSAASTEVEGNGTGSGWDGPWRHGVRGDSFATQPGLSYSNGGDLGVSGNALFVAAGTGASTVYRLLEETPNDPILYFSVLLHHDNRFNSIVAIGDETHTDAHSSALFRIGRMDIGDDQKVVRYWNPSALAWQSTGLEMHDGETYLLLVRAEAGGGAWGGGDDSLSVWVNPRLDEPEAEPDFHTAATDFGRLNGTRVLLGTSWNGPVFDEFRLGTDRAAVLPVVEGNPVLTVGESDSGSVVVTPEAESYAYGTSVTVQAVADAGYLFSRWTGDIESAQNPLTVIMTRDTEVTPVYISESEGYQITWSETEGGTVEVEPTQPGYAEGAEVVIRPVPEPGWRFDGWEHKIDWRVEAHVTVRADIDATPRFVRSAEGVGGFGATIREDLVTAEIFVDGTTGDNANDGSSASPVRTIQRGLDIAAQRISQGIGTRVIIAAGTYAEEIIVPGGRFDAPLLIEGAGWSPGTNTGDVRIVAVEPIDGWTLNADGVYEREWTNNWGFQPDPFANDPTPTPPELLRFEWLFVDDIPCYHKLSYAELLDGPDARIFVDEAANKIYLKPPAGASPETDLVEISRFRQNTPDQNNFPMWIKGASTAVHRQHIAVRNIVFEKGSGGFQRGGLHIHNASNILVEDIIARHNNSAGIVMVDANYITVRRSILADNTNSGLNGGPALHCLLEDLVVTGSNRRGAAAGYTGWTPAGLKFGFLADSTLRNIVVKENYSHGVWMDTGIRGVKMDHVHVHDNLRIGIYLENNNRNQTSGLGETVTVHMENCVFARNGERAQGLDIESIGGQAFLVVEQENYLGRYNLIYDHTANLRFGYNTRGPSGNFVLKASVVAALPGSNQRLFTQTGQLPGWTQVFDTLSVAYNDNLYLSPNANAFMNRGGGLITFDEWKAAVADNPFGTAADPRVDSRSRHVMDYDLDDPVLVRVEAVVESIDEGESTPAAFRIHRIALDRSEDLVVPLVWAEGAGFADSGDIVGELPASVTVPAGAGWVDLPLEVIADGVPEGPELLRVRLGEGGFLTTVDTAELTITDPDTAGLPLVSVHPLRTELREDNRLVPLARFERTGATDEPVTVFYAIDGDVEEGVDYEALPGSITIPAGASSVELSVRILADGTLQMPQTLVLTVERDPDLNYAPAPPAEAVFTVRDAETLQPDALRWSRSAASPHMPVTLTFRNPADTPLEVTLDSLGAEFFEHDEIYANGDLPWIDIAQSANRVTFNWALTNNDGITDPLPLGFDFPLFERTFGDIRIHSNGVLFLEDPVDPANTFRVPVNLPSEGSSVTPNMIAPFWANWAMDGDSAVYARAVDSETFVITYEGLYQQPGIPTRRRATWQVRLSVDGQMHFAYRSNETTVRHVVGLQGDNPAEGLTLGADDYAVSDRGTVLIPYSGIVMADTDAFTIPVGGSFEWTGTLRTGNLDPALYAGELFFRTNVPELSSITVPFDLYLDWNPSAPWLAGAESHPDFNTWVPWLGWVSDSAFPWVYLHDGQTWVYLAAVDDTIAIGFDAVLDAWTARGPDYHGWLFIFDGPFEGWGLLDEDGEALYSDGSWHTLNP
ncbi:MAG: right-handed parallel beta-helix repeat-containing protein [Opitutales bacterium]|nr:right-handed parallel beta-helix repeat-containing protein [Opitutales bacterium]